MTQINGQPLPGNPENFLKLIDSLKVGDKVRLTLFHKKETRHVELTLPERPVLPSDIRTSSSSTLQPTRGRSTRFPLP